MADNFNILDGCCNTDELENINNRLLQLQVILLQIQVILLEILDEVD